ncbi:MAG: hypothetical protein R3D33_15400 [Hyphomicrobiaceae bacterium]
MSSTKKPPVPRVAASDRISLIAFWGPVSRKRCEKAAAAAQAALIDCQAS